MGEEWAYYPHNSRVARSDAVVHGSDEIDSRPKFQKNPNKVQLLSQG